jgi:integrase
MTLEQVQAIRVAAAGWRTGPDVLGPKPDGKVRDICGDPAGTSTRPGEALALRPCDITGTRRGMVAHVQRTVVRRRGVVDFRQEHPKTDASRRLIAVPQFAAR